MPDISIFSVDEELINILKSFLSKKYKINTFYNTESLFDYLFNSVPSLIIADVRHRNSNILELINNIKNDPVFGQLPVLCILSDDINNINWKSYAVDDYIRKSDIEKDIKTRVKFGIERSNRVAEINPLTRLPGNISINRHIQSRLDSGAIFAIAYLDIDNFKPFNDKYGFSRGDEIIRATGRLILNIVKNIHSINSFVGHIGGDDFVYIMDIEYIETVSREIINSFDRIVPTFYDAQDYAKGCIEAVDRQNNKKIYSIMTISIGITNNESRKFLHYGEITEVASKMKSFAKKFSGSCFKTNRRMS